MADVQETDGERWRTLITVAVIAAMCSGVFTAGFSWAKVTENTTGIAELKISAVMKDGREMEELRGQLRLINAQLAVLVGQGGLKK